MNKLFKALEPARSTLKTVQFSNSGLTPAYVITYDLVHRALEHQLLRNVVNLTSMRILNPGATRFGGDNPRTTLKLVTMTCDVYVSPLRLVKPFFPQDSSTLRKVNLTFSGLTPQDATWLFSYLPTTLQELQIVLIMWTSSHLTLDEYQDRSHGATDRFPHQLLSRFSQLRSLCLMGFTLPVNLFVTLANLSSSIRRLKFYDSKWVPLDSSRSTRFPDHISGILDPSFTINLLSPFVHLVELHLGTLPTLMIDRYSTLTAEMTRRGIEFDFEPCVEHEVCDICGLRH
ncbi:hypothetical protein JCM5353_001045 [Sporobolomyces roseus]